jgi:hypothetical protein
MRPWIVCPHAKESNGKGDSHPYYILKTGNIEPKWRRKNMKHMFAGVI